MCADPDDGILARLFHRVASGTQPITTTGIEDVMWAADAEFGLKMASNVKDYKAAKKEVKKEFRRSVPQRQRRASVQMEPEAIKNALGGRVKHGGSTATLLVVDGRTNGVGGVQKCHLSWIGDSAAIVVDMLAPKSSRNLVFIETPNHVPERDEEAENVRPPARPIGDRRASSLHCHTCRPPSIISADACAAQTARKHT